MTGGMTPSGPSLDPPMAVRRPQIWRYECMAVGFIQPLCTASLQTLQTKMMITTTTDDWETRLSRCLMCGRPSWLPVSSCTATTLSSVCVCTSACNCHAFGRYFVFRAAYRTEYHTYLPLFHFTRKFSR